MNGGITMKISKRVRMLALLETELLEEVVLAPSMSPDANRI